MKMTRSRAICSATLVIFVVSGDASLLRATEIRGTVWAQNSKQPDKFIADSTVYLTEFGKTRSVVVKTDEQGQFVFSKVGPGIYVIRASAPRYATALIFPLMIAADDEVKYASMMLPTGHRQIGGADYANGISPTVGIVVEQMKSVLGIEAERMKPALGIVAEQMKLISDAEVCFESLGKARPLNCSKTNSIGVYETVLFSGKYRARVVVNGHSRHSEDVVIIGGGDTIRNFVLP